MCTLGSVGSIQRNDTNRPFSSSIRWSARIPSAELTTALPQSKTPRFLISPSYAVYASKANLSALSLVLPASKRRVALSHPRSAALSEQYTRHEHRSDLQHSDERLSDQLDSLCRQALQRCKYRVDAATCQNVVSEEIPAVRVRQVALRAPRLEPVSVEQFTLQR